MILSLKPKKPFKLEVRLSIHDRFSQQKIPKKETIIKHNYEKATFPTFVAFSIN